MVAEEIAMVGRERDYRVPGEPLLIQPCQDAADAVVYERDHPIGVGEDLVICGALEVPEPPHAAVFREGVPGPWRRGRACGLVSFSPGTACGGSNSTPSYIVLYGAGGVNG